MVLDNQVITETAEPTSCQENAELFQLTDTNTTVSKTRALSDFILRLSKGFEMTSSVPQRKTPNQPKIAPSRRLSTVSKISNSRSEKSQISNDSKARAQSRIWLWSSNYSNRFHKNQIDVLKKSATTPNPTLAPDKNKKIRFEAKNTPLARRSRLNQVSSSVTETASISKDPSVFSTSLVKTQPVEQHATSKFIANHNPFHLLWQRENNDKVHRLEAE